MDYRTFKPHPDLSSVVKLHWTLEVPVQTEAQRQLIIPDGCVDLIFILGDDVKRYTSGDEFIIQPRAMVLGQINEPFYVEPTGYVRSFAVRFYPYGFANFVSLPLKDLANKETPLPELFGNAVSRELQHNIVAAEDTASRIRIIEKFLLEKLNDQLTVDRVVKSTVDQMLSTNGSSSVQSILKGDPSRRRHLERKFMKQIGISPKQLGKVIRLQTALQLLLNRESESLTAIAYESEYYDQAHFIKDFKEFTGVTPKDFLEDRHMSLSALFYKRG